MKAWRAAALRLIFPLALRRAAVDLFGLDARCEVDLIEVLLLLCDVPLDEDRDDDDRDRPPFWATTVNGRRSIAAASATPMRLSIPNLLSTQRLSRVKEDEARKRWAELVTFSFFGKPNVSKILNEELK